MSILVIRAHSYQLAHDEITHQHGSEGVNTKVKSCSFLLIAERNEVYATGCFAKCPIITEDCCCACCLFLLLGCNVDITRQRSAPHRAADWWPRTAVHDDRLRGGETVQPRAWTRRHRHRHRQWNAVWQCINLDQHSYYLVFTTSHSSFMLNVFRVVYFKHLEMLNKFEIEICQILRDPCNPVYIY